MRETALEVRDVYVAYNSVKKMSMKQFFTRDRSGEQMIHAVNGISFRAEKGDIIGIIGPNGSGKSTLLRTIAGVFVPDSGSIDLKNNTCSLLAIGVGFMTDLTGRENIILSGLLLGFTLEEIREREEKIAEYSELEEFIDMPVRTYSSGMYSKLAFAITAMLRTDILLIDEVLSVGDEHFKKKSRETMEELIRDEERTVIIVSHMMEQLLELCTKVIWIDGGRVVMSGDPREVIEAYRSRTNVRKNSGEPAGEE